MPESRSTRFSHFNGSAEARAGSGGDLAPAVASWIRRLAPTEDGAGLRPASSPTMVAEATAAVGPSAVAWAVEVGHTMTTTIIREIPDFGGGDGPFETLRMGPESATLRSMVILVGAADAVPITDEALQGDREFVHRGISLDKVLRGVRLGHAGMARAFMAACAELAPPAERPAHMKYISDKLFEFIDSFASTMAAEYLAERDRWVTSTAAARQELVQAILDGEPVDAEVASQTLGYDLTRRHLAVTAWLDPAAGANTSELQRATIEFLQRLRCSATLVIPVGRTGLWAWGSWAHQANGPTSDAASGCPDTRIACGTVGTGVEGFRRSHEEAVLAERVARVGARPDVSVTRYDAVEIVALLTVDLNRARQFVQRELGPLAADDAHSADLRGTLRLYLDAERSLATAAAELHIARNTVTYRVKRAQELLGRDISERRFELHAALTVAHVLGSTVLTTDP